MMGVAWIAASVIAWATWGAFAVCMRRYFRRARESSPAKDWLVRAATVSTAAQLIVLAVAPPPGLALILLGIACFAVGNLLYWSALASHGQDRPAFACLPDTPKTLTAVGPYGLVRHPIYAAYLVCWLGGVLVTGQAWLLVTVAAMGLLYYRAASQEEAGFLASALADQYRAYQRRTGMFLPRLLPSAA
jgi:protein-S-isoprenylcysteine O-methyltransferase Ste14